MKIELHRKAANGDAVRGQLIISTSSIQTNKELHKGVCPFCVNTTNSLAPVGAQSSLRADRESEANKERDGERGFDTLENAKYIIPAGTYGLTVTYSPKFKRLMPVLQGVRGRSGIRIHRGTLPEHSLGCILVKSRDDEAAIADIIGTSKQSITIYDEKA